ncbi:predicted protein [Uncinocarpus reesii 1704]|uniref:Uncharacterized protein n=1 Tax=Uncinocarpus reesii (strain UAMH 1704) TaxID=336963 RepID=C4JI43_UNCRE|nr:uncharacterized protein UREG_01468 [Uncinocarpus reesii 1704]EEP76619.1 predicted protein [Uncinocarpus reesii 1704]
MAAGLIPRCYTAPARQLRCRVVTSLGNARQFSSTSTNGDDASNGPPRRPPTAGFDQTARRQNTKSLLQNVFTKSSPSSSNRPAHRPFDPQSSSGPIDARSLAAQVPQSGQGQGIIRRAPLSFKNLPQRRRPGTNQNILAAANALSRRPRKQGGQKRVNRRSGRKTSGNRGEEALDESVKAYDFEKKENACRSPVQYNPEPYSMDMLKPTWPALPMSGGDSTVANAGSVAEKLNWMGARYLNSFEPAPELAQRILDGKRVLFRSSEEKAEVLELLKTMIAANAQEKTERKGKVIKPKEVSFKAVANEERQRIVAAVVQGKYDQPLVDKAKYGGSPIVANVVRNLTNNGTYHSVQAKKFMEKFMKGLPGRLTSPQKAA